MPSLRSSLDLNRALQTNSAVLAVLFEAKQRFEDIFLHWREPIAVLDAAGNLFYFNHEWSYFCGVDPEMLRGQHILTVVDRGTREVLTPHLMRITRGHTRTAEFESAGYQDPSKCWKWTINKHTIDGIFEVTIIRTKDVSAVRAFRSEAVLTAVLERLCRMKRDFTLARSLQDIGFIFFSNICEHLGITRVTRATLRVHDSEGHQVDLDFADAGVLGRSVRIDNLPLEHIRNMGFSALTIGEDRIILPLWESGVAELVFDFQSIELESNVEEFLIEACRECSAAVQAFLQLQYEIERNQIQTEQTIMTKRDSRDRESAKEIADWFFRSPSSDSMLQAKPHVFGSTCKSASGVLGLIAVQHVEADLESKMFSRYLRGRTLGLADVLAIEKLGDNDRKALGFIAKSMQSAMIETARLKEKVFVVALLWDRRSGMVSVGSNLPFMMAAGVRSSVDTSLEGWSFLWSTAAPASGALVVEPLDGAPPQSNYTGLSVTLKAPEGHE